MEEILMTSENYIEILKQIEYIGKLSLPIYYNLNNLLFTTDKIFIFKFENKIIGFIIFEVKNKETIHIKSIAIKDEKKKKGFGTEIIKFLQNKYKIITLYVQKSNIIALNFYKKNLFLIVETLPDYYVNLNEKCAYLMKWNI